VSPRRPRVDVDALAGAIDRALGSPLGQLLERVLPRTAAQVRAARDDLPEVLSELEARALGEVGQEIDRQLSRVLVRRAPKKKSAA
jgi:hypothetical protein